MPHKGSYASKGDEKKVKKALANGKPHSAVAAMSKSAAKKKAKK